MKDEEDFFRSLVNKCIDAYRDLGNDGLALDLCKVQDRKLRAMVLNDEEYKAETKSIYAEQRLSEINEIEYLSNLAAKGGVDDGEDEEDDEYYAPRDGKKESKPTALNKDFLNMRLKAAQMKREIRAEMAGKQGDTERETNMFFYTSTTAEEIEDMITTELHSGSDEADVDELLDRKEKAPDGSVLRNKGRTLPPGPEAYETVLGNGEIVEL